VYVCVWTMKAIYMGLNLYKFSSVVQIVVAFKLDLENKI